MLIGSDYQSLRTRHSHILWRAQLRLIVGTWFQVLFHSPSGVLFAFPSRYLFTIDRKVYLALGGGPPRFGQGFTCPGLLEKTDIRAEDFRLRGFHLLWRSIPTPSTNLQLSYLTRWWQPSGRNKDHSLWKTQAKCSLLVIYNLTTPQLIFACQLIRK